MVHSDIEISSFAASVAPLLDLSIINKTTTTKKAQAVFTAESVTIVCFLFDSPRAFIARIVPVAEVIPGIIETRIPPRLPVITDNDDDFLVFLSNTGSSIVCFGITGLVIREVSNVGVPNRPASAGNKTGEESPIGELTGTLKIIIPKKPDKINTKIAKDMPTKDGAMPPFFNRSIRAFSVPIIRIEIASKTKNMIFLRVS